MKKHIGLLLCFNDVLLKGRTLLKREPLWGQGVTYEVYTDSRSYETLALNCICYNKNSANIATQQNIPLPQPPLSRVKKGVVAGGEYSEIHTLRRRAKSSWFFH